MFKQIFIELCNQKGESPTSVCLAIGLSNAAYSNWTEKTIPRDATLQKIADYFGVTVDYLLGNSDIPSKAEKPADYGELQEDVIIYHRDGKTVRKKFTKEQMDMLQAMIDAIPETPKDI